MKSQLMECFYQVTSVFVLLALPHLKSKTRQFQDAKKYKQKTFSIYTGPTEVVNQ